MKKIFLLLLVLIACDSKFQDTPESIQNNILQDDDFLEMLTLTTSKSGKNDGNENEINTSISRLFYLLDNRYTNFHLNAKKALEQPSEQFTKNLRERVALKSSTKGARYDAESFCQSPCGDNQANALSCVGGCKYSEAFCISHGGSFCGEMVTSCTKCLL
jgi:hypothetical protein